MIQLRWFHPSEYNEPVLQYRVQQDTQAYANPFNDAPFMKKMEWSQWFPVPHVYERDVDLDKEALRKWRKGE